MACENLTTELRKPLKIFMAAGEVSADRHGACLAKAILEQRSNTRLFGSGGEQMRAAGVDVAVQTAQLGYVGLQEAFRVFRPIRQAVKTLRHLIDVERPDMAVLVDGEGFSGPLASHLQARGIPFIYYFAPQVWFWGRWRARSIARKASLIIPAFQAEAEIYSRYGGRVAWLGHPLRELVKPETDTDKALASHGLDGSRRTVALMPGSRLQEIESFAPTLLDAARTLKLRHPDLQFILPLATRHFLPALVQKVDRAGLGQDIKIVDRDIYACLSCCELALLSSGTATLEAALLGIPMVAFYRLKPLTYLLAKQLVSTRFIAIPNILLNAPVVPELVQHDFTTERLVKSAREILEDKHRAQTIREHLACIAPLLGKPGVLSRAAATVLRECGGRSVSIDHATQKPSYT